jgi:hypothetical protein
MEQVITIGLDLAKNVYYVSRARDFSGRWASYLARYRSQDRLSSWLVRLCVKSRRFVNSGRLVPGRAARQRNRPWTQRTRTRARR